MLLRTIKEEFPAWDAPWLGVNGMWYARRPRTSPPWVVRAHNLTVLYERIAAKEGKQAP